MEMQTELTDSELALQLSTIPTTNLQKAWYISSLLRSLGRPARSVELASKCTQFYATPNFVEFLCGIPNSPIFLTPDCFVTTSSNGFVSSREITGNSDAKLKNFPPYGLEMVLGQKIDEDAVKVYFRKRRKIGSDSKYLLLEMETELSDSEIVNATELQKAWYIFALLVSFGRPARSIELASNCALFFATPSYVEFLARMPDSPIYFTPDYFVTISSVGYIPAREIAVNLNTELKIFPPYGFEIASGQRINEEAVKTYFRKRRKVRSEDEYLPVPKKRGILDNFQEEDQNAIILALPCSTVDPSGKVYLPNGNMSSAIELQSCNSEILAIDALQKEKGFFGESLINNSTCGNFNTGLENNESGKENEMVTLVNASKVNNQRRIQQHFNPVEGDTYQNLSMSGKNVTRAIQSRDIDFSLVQSPAICTTKKTDDNNSTRNINFIVTAVMEVVKQTNAGQCPTEAQTATHDYGTTVEDLEKKEGREEGPSLNSCCCIRDTGNQPIDTAEKQLKGEPVEGFVETCKTGVSSPEKEKSRTPLKSKANLMENFLSLCDQRVISSPKPKPDPKNAANQRLQSIGKTLDKCKFDHPLQFSKRDKKSILSKQNIKYNYNHVMNAKEKKEACNRNGEKSSIAASDQLDQRVLPDFEAFVAEEQEGSGGYGTVYKARRKSDGVTFAIKYPHANANRNHVHNELKMLERFGGKNFVIKYEGSFKSGNSDCLVLEHVEHDRPEVLKRDIDVQELRWYGYCMFKALAGLHKQGVVHRDVKPGNFLFNRKACKGYLIDFNLAMDLTQKHSATMNKAKAVQDVSLNRVSLPNEKSLPSTKSRKFVTAKALEVANQEQGKVSESFFPSMNMKNEIRRPKTCNEVGSMNITKSQGAEASGVTSAKDATSTRTPSGEKFREPLPCQGRKELISLVHEALQTTNHNAVSSPVSKRKRIAAPPRPTDCKFIYLTPMPLHSAGVAVGGAGLLKNKGDGKHNREGPCVGTKGFRAPEVLVRSQHQGSKVDTWSGGVTLLYLMIGRTPFAGDPDQNMKEIAKLRGSEDLWEVAKLHNRESSFPADLLDVKYLRSLKLQDWCKQNTRRPEFLDLIPRSLFDLVDKCLTVNPRLRISAEEALRHEFFNPCHEALRKQRLLKQPGVGADISSNLILNGQSQTFEEIS